MNKTVKMMCDREMAACKVQSYKPRTNKIKSKFNNKTNYVCNEHCDIVIERFKMALFVIMATSDSSINETIKCGKNKGFY